MMEEVLYKVFLEIQKAYNALDKKLSLEILVWYGIGTRTKRFLWLYWEHLLMVSQAGLYYGAPLKLYIVVTWWWIL